jgi:hypothetical protein
VDDEEIRSGTLGTCSGTLGTCFGTFGMCSRAESELKSSEKVVGGRESGLEDLSGVVDLNELYWN